MSGAELVRFCSKVEKRPDGCWVWTAYRMRNGYPQFASTRSGVTNLAHRRAYAHWRGPIPAGMEIDHLCRNRACVNPDHLEAVSHLENVRRGTNVNVIADGFRARTHCNHGHLFDERNTMRRADHPGRRCRTCSMLKARTYRARQKAAA